MPVFRLEKLRKAYHVIPQGDAIAHTLDRCWCRPQPDPTCPAVMLHRSLPPAEQLGAPPLGTGPFAV